MDIRASLTHLNLTSRILLCFWLTLLLVFLAGWFLILFDREDHETHGPLPPIKTGNDLALKLLTQDIETVRAWFAQQPEMDVHRIFVVYKEQELLSRTLPRPLRKMARRLNTQHPFLHRQRDHFVFVGRLLLLPNGEHVKILIRAKDPHRPWRQVILDNVLGVFLLAILFSGLISYGLARYISSPIRALRNATKQLAAGDLSTRVLPTLPTRQDELYSLAQDFDHMAEQLDRSVAAQKRLIQDISHELRSPVARLQFALALARKRLNQDSSQELDRIESECTQINNIITTLLNLPAFELDPSLALTDQVDIAVLLETLCDDLNYDSQRASIYYVNRLTQPVIFLASAQLLRSAFENILKNAQHYSEPTDAIRLTIEMQDRNIHIQCCDQGPGVPEDKIQDIFKPFYRTSEARDRSSGGYGLGLAIAKRAVDIHGGQIQARNELRGGLCVEIQLPLP